MKPLSITALLALLFISGLSFAQDISAGEKLFKANCQACHSIGKGKIVGPDLQNVLERREKEWLHKFIAEPMKMIQAGDPVAVKLFEDHNKIPMPDQKYLKASEIDDILAFVQEQSALAAEATQQADKKETSIEDKKEVIKAEAGTVLSTMDYFVYGVLAVCFVLVTIVLLLILQLLRSLRSFEKKASE